MSDILEGELFGKKIFFLYPPPMIKEELLKEIVANEYEVYFVQDEKKALKLINKFPLSICFINIDDGLNESEWEAWIQNVLKSEKLNTVGIGILSFNSDDELKKKYLIDIGIQCGFIKLKMGLQESTKIILDVLKANEAKGRRKYVRGDCRNDQLANLNMKSGSNLIRAKIYDISSVGFSCVFENDPVFKKNTLLNDVQLSLRGVNLKIDGVVFGQHEDEGLTKYVVLFANKVDLDQKNKLRLYIRTLLQQDMDKLAQTL